MKPVGENSFLPAIVWPRAGRGANWCPGCSLLDWPDALDRRCSAIRTIMVSRTIRSLQHSIARAPAPSSRTFGARQGKLGAIAVEFLLAALSNFLPWATP